MARAGVVTVFCSQLGLAISFDTREMIEVLENLRDNISKRVWKCAIADEKIV